MSLQQWLDNSWIKSIEPSRQEVAGLLAIAEREIADAALAGMSSDGRFEHAYNAVRSLSQLALHAAGFAVPKGGRQHEWTIGSLKYTLAGDWVEKADHFDYCRRLRNKSLYDRSGMTQQRDADDLLCEATKLMAAVQAWLEKDHPRLIDEDASRS